jgi:hypothetical protein
MSKKDYILMAAAMVRAARLCETDSQRRGVSRAAAALSEALASDNPRFDRARFLAACEVR